uniref:BHLH domain-containing protein n=1 Tax=Knipowitschia caucasica TaxID=637954 RepID=A0AAV2MJT7_KNICA
MYRSTKGASKARRDQINAEIRNLKDLLPIADSDKARLSYLHIMSLACMYTRKSVFFIQDRLLRCHFNTSKSVRRQSAGNKLVLIRARCLSPPSSSTTAGSYWASNPVWVCFCSPLEPHPSRSGPNSEREVPSTTGCPLADADLFVACFYSQHGRDMRLYSAQESVSFYLGFDVTALRSRSWYSLLHPQDLSHASTQHRSLLREGGEGRAEMVVRIQAQDQTWVWLYMVLQLQPGEVPVTSNNYIISDSEAWAVRQQLSSEQTQLNIVLTSGTSQEGLSLQSPDTLSSPDQVFTPGSSGLSGQSFDFSTAGCSVTSSDEPSSSAAEPLQLEGDPRSSLSSLEEDSFFQQNPVRDEIRSATSSPTPVTVETVEDLDFLTQNILLPPSFQLDPPLPSLPLPLPPVPTSRTQMKEFVCTPPYTPQVTAAFPFEPLFSFDPTGTTTPPPSATTTTTTTSTAPASAPPTTASSPVPPTSLSTKLPLALPTPSTDLLFPIEPCSGSLYEKLPPTPDSPGDGDCTVMTVPEVRGPLYVDVPLGPLQCPPEGLLTPEASPGKQPYLSFFSIEREKEHAEISLLAQHISSLAEGYYMDPLLTKMSPSSCPPSPFMSPAVETSDVDAVHVLREFYPIKAWRGLDFPMFLDEDNSLFEENILETLLQDDFASLQAPSPPVVPTLSDPTSPQTPVCWHQPSQFEGVGQMCSVQSAHRNSMAGCGVSATSESMDYAEGEGQAEEPMEIEVVSSPVSSCSSIPASPPLILTVSPGVSSPVASPPPAMTRTQSLLEELAVLEPMFGAGPCFIPSITFHLLPSSPPFCPGASFAQQQL